MILCVDCGNTIIKIGLFNDGNLVKVFSLKTDKNKSSDEYAILLKSLIDKPVSASIICSVVPLVTPILKKAIKDVFLIESLVLDKNLKTKIAIKIDNPSELGADILAGVIGAKKYTPFPFVVADLGTATKICVVDKVGNIRGCIITCGMEISLKALVGNTAQLLETPLSVPNKIIGTNTKDSIQSGIVLGQAYMINEFCKKIEEELGSKINRVLTGGLSKIIKNKVDDFVYDPYVVLKGLYEIYLMNVRE